MEEHRDGESHWPMRGARALSSPALWKLLFAVAAPLGTAGTFALNWMHGQMDDAIKLEERRADKALDNVRKDIASGYIPTEKSEAAHEGTDRTAARVAVLEQQYIDETATRVRYQAAAVERDWRKRAASGEAAERRFRRLSRDWPCLKPPRYPCSDDSGCCPPDDSARIALETRPP